jgi:hypothetical protein
MDGDIAATEPLVRLQVESPSIALLLLNQGEAELPCWPYKLSKRLGGAVKLQDVGADEAGGGLNNSFFGYYSHSTKDEVGRLTAALDILTRFAIDRSGTHAKCASSHSREPES